jgi:NAD(P)H-dependent FMN reductase
VRILAISGSLQKSSANRELCESLAKHAPAGVEIAVLDGLDGLPHFNPDLESGERSAPPSVAALRRALAASDAVFIATPEYGHSLPGSLKNAIDWVIGSGELENKVVAITAVVPHPDRGRRGLGALRDTLGAVKATIVGGEPLVRGTGLADDARKLLAALVAEVERARAAASDA